MSIKATESAGGSSQKTLTVLISRSASQLADMSMRAAERNIGVIPFPLSTIESTIDQYNPESIAHDLSNCSWLLFTSANAAAIFFDYTSLHQITVPTQVSMGAIGRKTAAAIEKYGYGVSLCPQTEVAEGLLDEFLQVEVNPDRTIILPSAEQVRPVLQAGLIRAGYQVKKIDVYRAVATPREQLPAIAGEKIDYYCFLSSSAVERYDELFGKPARTAVSIGPITTDTMRQCGWSDIIELPEPNLDRLWKVIHA